MRILLILAVLVAALPGRAEEIAEEIEVDVELLLLVDVSRSMTPRELEIQRRGYAEALRSGAVYRAIRAGLLQRVALAYVEWAGVHGQRAIVPWRLVESQADLDAVAAALTADFTGAMRRTSIASALLYGRDSLAENRYLGLRRVIDVSGDGPNNAGPPVLEARAQVLAAGITVNGLPLMTREGLGGQWHLDDLDVYYRECVIGGPGAFVIPVLDWADFADAVRRKLVLELAGPGLDIGPATLAAPDPIPVQARAPYDCLIGEKIWERNRRDWMQP